MTAVVFSLPMRSSTRGCASDCMQAAAERQLCTCTTVLQHPMSDISRLERSNNSTQTTDVKQSTQPQTEQQLQLSTWVVTHHVNLGCTPSVNGSQEKLSARSVQSGHCVHAYCHATPTPPQTPSSRHMLCTVLFQLPLCKLETMLRLAAATQQLVCS